MLYVFSELLPKEMQILINIVFLIIVEYSFLTHIAYVLRTRKAVKIAIEAIFKEYKATLCGTLQSYK
jgi:uncharacterized membrane protein YesL